MVKLWSGAYFPNERWADNREYYRQILSDYKSSPSLRKMAAEGLSLQEQFSPARRHTRLVGHRVGIYAFQNHTWEERGNGLIAVRELEQLLEIDIGQELVKMAEHPYDAEIVQENVRVPKSDGSYVQGVRMRDVLRKTGAVKAAESYLKIQFGFYGYADYYFEPLRESVSPARPLEFQVVAYFSVDEKLVKEKKRIIQARFEKKPSGNVPTNNFRFRTAVR